MTQTRALETTRDDCAFDALCGALQGAYHATPGDYFITPDWFETAGYESSFKEEFTGDKRQMRQCQVCAIGAAACSVVCTGNGHTLRDVNVVDSTELASEVFSLEELYAMETAFESYLTRGWDHDDGCLLDGEDEVDDAECEGNTVTIWYGEPWDDAFPDQPQNRLIAIFANAVALGKFDIDRIPKRLPTLKMSVTGNVVFYEVIWPEPDKPLSIFDE